MSETIFENFPNDASMTSTAIRKIGGKLYLTMEGINKTKLSVPLSSIRPEHFDRLREKLQEDSK